MDNTINREDISNALKQFDRKKDSEYIHSLADKSRQISSALGTDTPITVLNDIRSMMQDIQKELRDYTRRNDNMIEIMMHSFADIKSDNNDRHAEIMAYIEKMSTKGLTTSVIPLRAEKITSSDKFYYKGDEIKTAPGVIACMLIHLNIMISKEIDTSNDISDITPMEFKHWVSAVSILREVDSRKTPNLGVINLPKKTSDEAITALNIIASTVQGRTVVCLIDHLRRLINECPSIVKFTDEIRRRAMLCPGVIGSSRLRCLTAISFPYLTNEGALNITTRNPPITGSAIVLSNVRSMKADQKKIYATCILRNGKSPMPASVIALNHTDFNKWKDSDDKQHTTT